MTKEQELARKIGEFYLKKNDGDYEKAKEQVVNLHVTNLVWKEELSCSWLEIHLARPGLIIGRKGMNLDELEKFLEVKVKVFESDHWNNWLVPEDWSRYDPPARFDFEAAEYDFPEPDEYVDPNRYL